MAERTAIPKIPEYTDYIENIKSDLLEQFRCKHNTEVLVNALARQFADVYGFYYQLMVLRSLKTAVGAQLDGIGDIVAMSRAEALVTANLAWQNVPMDDETYRLYLAWKICQNTGDSTHRDVYRTLRMFWDKPLYYFEKPEHPATIFFETGELEASDNASALMLMPRIKAAGVAMNIHATTVYPGMGNEVSVGFGVLGGDMSTSLPQYIPYKTLENTVRSGGAVATISSTPLPSVKVA